MSDISSRGNLPLAVGAGITIIVFVLALNFLGWLSGVGNKPSHELPPKAVIAVSTNEMQSAVSNKNERLPVVTNVTEKSSGYHVVTKISSIKFK